jgi:hypothetical protein
VDVLDFPRTAGLPSSQAHDGVADSVVPMPWFADIRYSLVTPLGHRYPSVHYRVLQSQRYHMCVYKMKNDY